MSGHGSALICTFSHRSSRMHGWTSACRGWVESTRTHSRSSTDHLWDLSLRLESAFNSGHVSRLWRKFKFVVLPGRSRLVHVFVHFAKECLFSCLNPRVRHRDCIWSWVNRSHFLDRQILFDFIWASSLTANTWHLISHLSRVSRIGPLGHSLLSWHSIGAYCFLSSCHGDLSPPLAIAGWFHLHNATYCSLRRLIKRFECFLSQSCVRAWIFRVFPGLSDELILLVLFSHQLRYFAQVSDALVW